MLQHAILNRVSPYPDPPSEAPTNTQYEVTIADEGEEFWFAVERSVFFIATIHQIAD